MKKEIGTVPFVAPQNWEMEYINKLNKVYRRLYDSEEQCRKLEEFLQENYPEVLWHYRMIGVSRR